MIGNVTGKAATHRLKKLFVGGVEVKSGDEAPMGATIDLEFYGA
jgi:hypothetical protein